MKRFINNFLNSDIKRIIIVFMVFNLILKILLMLFMGADSAPIDDGVDYYTIAGNLVRNQEFAGIYGITSVRAPLYPFFLAFLYLLSNGNLILIRIFQILISMLMYPLIYIFTKKLNLDKNKRFQIVIFAIYSYYPVFIYLPFRILTENLFILLLMLFSILFINYKGIRECMLCGMIAGLLSLTRPMFILFPAFALIYIYYRSNKKIVPLIRDFLIISIFMIITILPWSARNYILWGDFCLITTNSGNTIMINNNDLLFEIEGPAPQNRVFKMELLHPDFMPGTELWESMNELQRDKVLQKRTFQWIRNNPSRFLRLIPVKLWSFWHYSQNPQTPQIGKSVQDIGSIFSYLILLPFTLFGFFISFRVLRFPDSVYPLTLLLLFLFTTIIFGGSLRFRIPLEIFLILWGSMGIDHVLTRIKGLKDGKSSTETE